MVKRKILKNENLKRRKDTKYIKIILKYYREKINIRTKNEIEPSSLIEEVYNIIYNNIYDKLIIIYVISPGWKSYWL